MAWRWRFHFDDSKIIVQDLENIIKITKVGNRFSYIGQLYFSWHKILEIFGNSLFKGILCNAIFA